MNPKLQSKMKPGNTKEKKHEDTDNDKKYNGTKHENNDMDTESNDKDEPPTKKVKATASNRDDASNGPHDKSSVVEDGDS